MVKAGFMLVFMGIETPDTDSLMGINKVQNTRQSLILDAFLRDGNSIRLKIKNFGKNENISWSIGYYSPAMLAILEDIVIHLL